MPSVSDLGQKIKRENPGSYDEYSDHELGEFMKEEFPERYPEYTDALVFGSYQPSRFESLEKHLSGDFAPLQTTGMEKRIDNLMNSFSVRSGFISGFFRMKAADYKEREIADIAKTQEYLVDMYMKLERTSRLNKQAEVEFKRFVHENARDLIQMEAEADLILKAREQGLNVEQFTNIQFREYEIGLMDKQLSMENRHRIDIMVAESQIRIKEQLELQRGIAQIENNNKLLAVQRDWERFKNEKDLALQTIILSNIREVAEIQKLTDILLDNLEQVKILKALPNADQLLDAIAVLNRGTEGYKAAIDERFDGLLKTVQ